MSEGIKAGDRFEWIGSLPLEKGRFVEALTAENGGWNVRYTDTGRMGFCLLLGSLDAWRRLPAPGSREAMDHNTRAHYIDRCSVISALGGQCICVGLHVSHIFPHPGPGAKKPTPSDPWEEHLRQEREIAARMVTTTRLECNSDLPFQRGHWEPSISGLAGGFVGVWRRR